MYVKLSYFLNFTHTTAARNLSEAFCRHKADYHFGVFSRFLRVLSAKPVTSGYSGPVYAKEAIGTVLVRERSSENVLVVAILENQPAVVIKVTSV